MQYQTKQSVQKKKKKNTLCIVSSKLAQIHTHTHTTKMKHSLWKLYSIAALNYMIAILYKIQG